MKARSAFALSVGLSIAATGAAVYYERRLRPLFRRWGATDEEMAAPMPGDETVTHPSWAVTYAVSIDAPPSDVWPWLVQMGVGRAGFYSYDMIEKRLGLDVHSVELIVPELQGLAVGNAMPFGAFDLPVVALERDRLLLLEASDEKGAGSFCFELLSVADGTRLVFRGRARFAEWDVETASRSAAGLRQIPIILGFEPGSFVMFRRMLLGLKERAERTEREGRDAVTAPDGWWAERVMAMDQHLAEREALLDEEEKQADILVAEVAATKEAVLAGVKTQVEEAKARIGKTRAGLRASAPTAEAPAPPAIEPDAEADDGPGPVHVAEPPAPMPVDPES